MTRRLVKSSRKRTVSLHVLAGPPLDGFVCGPLAVRLTPAACAAHRAVEIGPRAKGGARRLHSPCPSCRVGKAHALGRTPRRWPDGAPIVRLALRRAT